MNIYLSVLILVIGCIVINYFADLLGDNLSVLGVKLKVPNTVRGATFEAVSSSLPELLTALVGALAVVNGNPDGFADVGVGTISGSALFNLLLIPMLSVLFYKGSVNVEVEKRHIVRDIGMYFTSILILFISSIFGTLNLFTGIALVINYGIYSFMLYKESKKNTEDFEEVEDSFKKLVSISILCLVPIAFAVHYCVEASEVIAHRFGTPQMIVSLIVLAIVTSIPDTLLSVKSARKGELDASIANAVGSNIFDICICLGLPLILTGINVNVVFSEVAYLFGFLFTSATLSGVLFLNGISKKSSLLMGVNYIVFIVYIIIFKLR